LSVDELKDAIKETMPDKFAGLNFKKLLAAFDKNQNGFIEQDEFLDLMDQATSSGANTT
jgi:Ca2+-binding EF-hand superfamily protein